MRAAGAPNIHHRAAGKTPRPAPRFPPVSFSEKPRQFIEKPREFTGIYRNLRKFEFARTRPAASRSYMNAPRIPDGNCGEMRDQSRPMRERLPAKKGSAPLDRLGQALRCKRSFLGAVEKPLLTRSIPSSSVGTGHRRHSGESRNPFSSADQIGHAPSFPPRGYRIPALRGGEAVAAPPGEKSKWIPARGRNDGGFPASRGLFNNSSEGELFQQPQFGSVCQVRSEGQSRLFEKGLRPMR